MQLVSLWRLIEGSICIRVLGRWLLSRLAQSLPTQNDALVRLKMYIYVYLHIHTKVQNAAKVYYSVSQLRAARETKRARTFRNRN